MIVSTRSGKVRGLERPGSTAFLGIPFAAPPVGEHRFQAPAPVVPWDDVRDATHYGPTPQRRPFGDLTTIPEPSIPGDSTLNVNVFTPAPGDRDARLPVFVWIHGGGYFAGSPASPWYDGRSFNRNGVVTVTLSYRLGFDGFGEIEGAPLNRGILDQIAALRWVQENIAEFGGDPGRVTIGGQSAGGGSVLTLMSTPLTAGLFHAAVSESGAMSRMRPDQARTIAGRMAAAAGLDGGLEGWLGLDENAILDLQKPLQMSSSEGPEPSVQELVAALPNGWRDAIGLSFVPVVDGETVLAFEEAMRSGPHRNTPLLLGTTADEFPISSAPQDAAEVETALLAVGVSEAAVSRFLAQAEPLGSELLRAQLLNRSRFRMQAVNAASVRSAPTWMYDFRRRAEPLNLAAHCLEVPFVWDQLNAEGVAAVLGGKPPQSLADIMHADWTGFIASGSCSWPSAGEELGGAMCYDQESGFDADAYRLEVELLRVRRP